MSDPLPGSTVGVVVCTFTARRHEQVVAAVASVLDQSRPAAQVVVVVDGPEELAAPTRARLAPLGDRVEVVCLGANRGVAVARTRGVARLGTDLVAFLDDDAVADPTWLEELVAPLADPRVLGVSGRSLPIFDAPRPAWLPDEFLWTVGCSYAGMPEEVAVVRNFYGGCAVVRRDVFEAVGGFEAGTGHLGRFVGGAEEADFCLRATVATGGVFTFTPAATIHHHVPGSRLTWAYFVRRCFGEGVMKAQLAGRLARGSLDPERAFALRMPVAVVRHLSTRDRRAPALGIVVGVASVVAGLVAGRLRGPAPVERSRGARP